MKINLINTLESAKKYLEEAASTGTDPDLLWNRHMIKPYWSTISQYAPFDHSFMQPKPIRDISMLRRQLEILGTLDFDSLVDRFEDIAAILPKGDDDPVFVAIYPLDDGNHAVKMRQNGVIGSCVFGNITLQINPLAEDFERWITYVFAHEYYHSVWGHHWFVQKQGEGLKNNLLETLVNEGEADYFATMIHPDLKPKWLDVQDVRRSWDALKDVLEEQDRNKFDKFLFGSEEDHIPWTAGYKVGYHLVSSYMSSSASSDFTALLDTPPDAIGNGALSNDERQADR